MQRYAAAARALAYAGALAGSVLAFSSARAADDTRQIAAAGGQRASAIPVVVASLNAEFTEPNNESIPADRATPSPSPSGRAPRIRMMITGDASFYDEKGETSSGERYDPRAFTAAAQILLRDQFGGIRFGRNYQPSYGVAEWGGKKAIIKFNDVGPLAPGRAFDFSRAAMEYFDGIDLGVLPHVTVRLLPLGRDYAQGPVTEAAIEAEIDEAAPAAFATASVASAADTRCGSNSLSLQPISLDTIQQRLVKTASLDFIAPANIESDAQFGSNVDLTNDLGTTEPSEILP